MFMPLLMVHLPGDFGRSHNLTDQKQQPSSNTQEHFNAKG